MTRNELIAAVTAAQAAHNDAVAVLHAFDCAIEQNTFATLADAEAEVEDKLRDMAHQDCEGSYNCGQETYEQEFIVGGVHYMGTLECEYDRHDKTYYYLDRAKFSSKELSPLDGAPI